MKLITVVGNWNVLELDTLDPVEYAVTKGKALYHNRNKEVAIRLAELLSHNDSEEDLEPA